MSKSNLVQDAYWNRYTDLVPEEDVIGVLDRQTAELTKLFDTIDEKKSTYRYQPDKWSIKELVAHIADTERIFQYRALSIARGDTRSLLGFDEKQFAANAEADARPFRDIVEELLAVRRSTLALFRGFSQTAWNRVGLANDNKISVQSLAFVAAGHVRHHMNVLREKYSA